MSDATPLSILDDHPRGRAWTFNQKALAVITAVVIGIPSLLFGLLILVILSMDSEQKVAGEMTLTSDWVEIVSRRPLRPSKQYQSIVLEVAEPLVKDNWYGQVVRPDGTELHPEVILVNEQGDAIPVNVRRSMTPSRYGNAISGRVPDGVYLKVRVRCDKPLRLRRIVWHCWQGK